eukprot:Sspe_Gene.43622::Locus_21294_Transcript_1_1_Confidence_1.000_Length_1751::g.43622::m.43622
MDSSPPKNLTNSVQVMHPVPSRSARLNMVRIEESEWHHPISFQKRCTSWNSTYPRPGASRTLKMRRSFDCSLSSSRVAMYASTAVAKSMSRRPGERIRLEGDKGADATEARDTVMLSNPLAVRSEPPSDSHDDLEVPLLRNGLCRLLSPDVLDPHPILLQCDGQGTLWASSIEGLGNGLGGGG